MDSLVSQAPRNRFLVLSQFLQYGQHLYRGGKIGRIHLPRPVVRLQVLERAPACPGGEKAHVGRADLLLLRPDGGYKALAAQSIPRVMSLSTAGCSTTLAWWPSEQ